MAGVQIIVRVAPGRGNSRMGTLDRNGKPVDLEFANGDKVTVECRGKHKSRKKTTPKKVKRYPK